MGPRMGQNKNPGTGVGFGRRRGLGAALAAFAVAARPALASSFIAENETVLTVIVAGAAALAIAAGLWALAEQNVSVKLRRVLRVAGARTRAAVGERASYDCVELRGEPSLSSTIAGGVNGDSLGIGQLGAGGRAVIAGVSGRPGSRHGGNHPIRDLADAVVIVV